MDERRDTQLMESVDQKSCRNPHRLRYVIALFRVPDSSMPYRSANTAINHGAVSKKGLEHQYLFSSDHSAFPRATTKMPALLSAAFGSPAWYQVTQTGKVPWLRFAPLGAEPARARKPQSLHDQWARQRSPARCAFHLKSKVGLDCFTSSSSVNRQGNAS